HHLPAGRRAFALAGHFSRLPEGGELAANPVPADAGTGPFEVRKAKGALLRTDGLEDEGRLGPPRRAGLAHGPLELPAGVQQGVKNEVDVRPGVVPALVPGLRTLFQGLVVAFLVVLDESLQADVTAHLVPQMVASQEQEQARDAAVAVPEGMNAEEI